MSNPRRRVRPTPHWVTALVLLSISTAASGLDLAAAQRWQLANGMTLLVLEDRTLPVVSVQMHYRVGARNEDNGRTGLAHFLEHMAFRATRDFPGAVGLTAPIYAVGGEWHGYTWVDQTAYYETVPREHVDLVLRIEAQRMAHLELAAGNVEAERGGVLSELHGYENDPGTVLHDAVTAAVFLQHPYRNNTIGWESDVAALQHGDLVAFYRAHYKPTNAVLAVAGDVSAPAVRARVEELFGPITGGAPTPPVPTVEPLQYGERRVVLEGAGARSHFELSWIAPAIGDETYPAFLLLQEVLAGGSGVNFRQEDGATNASEESLLAVATAGQAEDLETWFPPAEHPYVFAVSGTVGEVANGRTQEAAAIEASLESAIERALSALREREVGDATLASAKARVAAELLFDVETTEDAAHELAFFAGLHALDARLALPSRVAAVTATQLREVARRYLDPARRTVGWYRAGPPRARSAAPAVATTVDGTAIPAKRRKSVTCADPSSSPAVRQLSGGLTGLVQRVPSSPAVHVGAVLPGSWEVPATWQASAPVWGHTALGVRANPKELRAALAQLRAVVGKLVPAAGQAREPATPEDAAAVAMEQALGLREPTPAPIATPVLVTVVGDIDVESAAAALEKELGTLGAAARATGAPLQAPRDVELPFAGAAAQPQLRYVVPAPGPAEREALAWQLALYVLSHGYEGRLGLEAITRRGLVYHIDSRYDSDGARAWLSIATGVDAPNLAPLQSVLSEELERLREQPPSSAEIAEARAHLLGRERTAALSNAEIAGELAKQWLGSGRVRDAGELARELAAISDDDVRRVIPALTAGATVTVKLAQ